MKVGVSIFFRSVSKGWPGILVLAGWLFLSPESFAAPPVGGRPTLATAAMCEDIRYSSPYNAGICFSVSIGKVYCYTAFESVAETAVVYHNWFHRDRLSTRKKLSLQSPQDSAFSTILLREADKGPWRVEVVDGKGNLISVLRFSIAE
jgi:hypothetical protein